MINTRVIPKLVLILFGRTCNTIYQNSNETHIFRSALPFQQASVDVCNSNRSRVTAGFVKTVVCNIPKIGKKKWTKTQIYSLTSSSLSDAIHLTHFLKVFETPPSECIRRSFVFSGSPGHLFWSSGHAVRISMIEECGKPFSIKRSFRFSNFLISHKILQHNVARSKHLFSCLHGDPLSGNEYYFHVLTRCVFFFSHEWNIHFSSYISHASERWMVLPFSFVCFFLYLTFLRWGMHNSFHKISCNSRSVYEWCTDIRRCLLQR